MKPLAAWLNHFANGSRLRRNISMTLGRQLLAALAQLLLVVVIARELGPEGNGLFAMAILLPTMLVNFLNLGIGSATVYHVGRGDVPAGQAVRENLRLGVMIASVGLALAVPVAFLWGESLFPGVPVALLYLGLAAFPISLLLAYFNTILQGLEDFRSFNITVLLPAYVTLGAALVGLYILNAGVAGVVVAYLLGQLAGLLLTIRLLARHRQEHSGKSLAFSARTYRSHTLAYGWKAHLSNILAFVNYRADIFLVNFFMNPVATGLYFVAVQIAERLWMLSQAASTVLLPRLSAMHNEPDARHRLTQRAALVVAGLTATGAAFLLVAVLFLVEPVFGPEYHDAIEPFIWLLPGVIVGAAARVQSNCIAAAGKPEWNMRVSILVVFINVIGNVLLIPEMGLQGAAIATSIAYMVNAAIKYYLVKKTINL